VPIVHAFVDAEVSDDLRRKSLFSGDLFVYSPRPSTTSFCQLGRQALEQTLGPDPIWAQQRLSEVEFAALFRAAARNFRALVADFAGSIVGDFGCDPSRTFIGAPSLAAITGRGFISHGLGIPLHPHRDTWYAASPAQINWWLPLFDLDASAAFAFHPRYWDQPVHNSSSEFDYDAWTDAGELGRLATPADLIAQPRSIDPIELTPQVRIQCPAGGVIFSSVAQLYSTIPNETLKTHFSIHFQTISQDDLEQGNGPSNLDADPQGTSLSAFVRSSDRTVIPAELVQKDLRRRQHESALRHSL